MEVIDSVIRALEGVMAGGLDHGSGQLRGGKVREKPPSLALQFPNK